MQSPILSLTQEARALPYRERATILAAIPETTLHHCLAELFEAMSTDYNVSVTHGANELGKDLVIVRSDPLAPDVIAVVVKRGNLKGRTAGDMDGLSATIDAILTSKGRKALDEIVSQIRQSEKHDAEVRSSLLKLRVNKVIVVLVGDISHNLRVRIEAELDGRVEVLDMKWLVEAFTHHSPKVFFDGRAIDFLDTLIRSLEVDTFYARAGKTLSECYVEPIVAPMDRGVSVSEADLVVHLARKRQKLSQLTKPLREKARLLLVGDPGSGKSKALAKLCIDRYREILSRLTTGDSEKQRVGIPLLVSAIRVDGAEDSNALMEALLPAQTRERFFVDMIFVDGLDEVPSLRRSALLKTCCELAAQYSCGLLVTTRRLASMATAPEGFQRFELMPFELGQAVKLMEKILSDVNALPVLRDGLRKVGGQIPMSPLSLLLLMEVVTERKEVPSSIAELYERFLDLVFGRWDQEKGITVLFEYVVKKRFLARMAHDLFVSKSRLEAPVDEFRLYCESFASEYKWGSADISGFLREIERAGVLDIHEEVVFRHRSFLEYFAAMYLYERRGESAAGNEQVARLYFDGLWGEVVFYFVGIARELQPGLLDAILDSDAGAEAAAVDKVLVGRLLQAGWFTKHSIKKAGLIRCMAYLPKAGGRLEELAAGAKLKVPVLFRDVYVMLLAEMGFGSWALQKEGVEVLDELAEEKPAQRDSYLVRIALLWALRRCLDQAQHERLLSAYIEDVEVGGLEPATEARYLLLGSLTSEGNKQIQSAVLKRIRRLKKGAPNLLKGVLPEPTKGFRRKNAKVSG